MTVVSDAHDITPQTTSGCGETVLARSRYLGLESLDDQSAVVLHTDTAARLRLSRAVYDFLASFEPPRAFGSRPGEAQDALLRQRVERLCAKGFLVPVGTPDRTRRARRWCAPAHRLFNTPACDLAAERPDVAVVGIPFDLGSRSALNSRNAPVLIREQSLGFDYVCDFRTGRPRGWYDADRGRRILDGVTIADCGDVFVEYGEPQGALFDRINDLVGDLDGSVLAVLGGDPTVTYPVVRRLQATQPLAVIHLGRDPGFATSSGRAVNAANLGGHIRRLPNVAALVHADHRSADAGAGREPWSGIPPHMPVFLILDVDVLDPSYAMQPDDEAAGPGLTLGQAQDLVRELGLARRIAGLGLVGLAPDGPPGRLAAITACHLLLASLGAAFAKAAA